MKSKPFIKKQLRSKLNSNQYHKELVAHGILMRIELAMVFTGKEVFLKQKRNYLGVRYQESGDRLYL